MKYAEKLKDPRWQKKRLQILERDNWKCRACGTTEKTLHVHHIFYMQDTEPWDVHDGLLITFCKDCHEGICENGPCSSCDEYKKDCFGVATDPHDIIIHVADLLNCLWQNSEFYGGHDYHTILSNAYYMAKP